MKHRDFQGFRFGKIHTSDLNLEVVSSSNRYEARILPTPVDTVSDIPGGDGQYYFGSINKNREITCNVAFDNVSEEIYRKIRQLFATDKLLDLVFDEEPYKTWRAKIKQKPEFKSLCFTDKETGKRVYKGEGRLVFICYYPYAYGFDKYIVRAADYYMLNTPECIIENLQDDENLFVKQRKEKMPQKIEEDIKYHYNLSPSDYEGDSFLNDYRDKSHQNKGFRSWKPNGKKPWKTGFPSFEQVQNGELFFDTPQGEKTIIDTRGYWDNIPEWQGTAQLLTTPTLDFDQELMYLPQYSKANYINMETGFESNTSMIGSRLLVYNPGDLPIDWEIRFDENKRGFWSTRGGVKFRVSRYNVERLPLAAAVDWCGMTTYNITDNEDYKYGTKYFKRGVLDLENISNYFEEQFSGKTYSEQMELLEQLDLKIKKPEEDSAGVYYTPQEILTLLKQGDIPVDKIDIPYSKKYTWREIREKDTLKERMGQTNSELYLDCTTSFDLRLNYNQGWGSFLRSNFMLKNLGEVHPNHCYYVEPIPREKLDFFIKLFYWQTIQWRGTKTVSGEFIELDNWKTMLPESFFDKDKLIDGEYYIKDINNPLVPFLKNFINFNKNGKMTINNSNSANTLRQLYSNLNFEDGIAFADRYRELYEECINDMEKYELYWDTLKKLLSIIASAMYKLIEKGEQVDAPEGMEPSEYIKKLYPNSEEDFIDSFINSYINYPQEYIGIDMRDLDYGNFVFNGYKNPSWMTEDYLEIDQQKLLNVQLLKDYLSAIGEDEDAIFNGKIMYYDRSLIEDNKFISLRNKMDKLLRDGGCLNDLLSNYYYLNSCEHMLYTTENPNGQEFNYKPNKIVLNDAIIQGKWFKIPPGWSLITIEPVVDENYFGGKRWEDARPFDYGYGGDINEEKREVQQLFDYVFELAREEFFSIYPIEKIINNHFITKDYVLNASETYDFSLGTEDPIDEFLKFKIWCEAFIDQFPKEQYYLVNSYYRKIQNEAEYLFLKCINNFWNLISSYFTWTSQRGVYFEPDKDVLNWNEDDIGELLLTNPTDEDYDITGQPLRNINGDISDWWWYACNYFWANYPPVYWAMADMLNKIKIKYTPLFY